jgi:hypothetical protein
MAEQPATGDNQYPALGGVDLNFNTLANVDTLYVDNIYSSGDPINVYKSLTCYGGLDLQLRDIVNVSNIDLLTINGQPYIERFEEHKRSPTNDAMKEAFITCDSNIELLDEFYYAGKKIDEIEKMWIKSETNLLNKCHNVVTEAKPVRECKMKKEKFNIRDEPRYKRYDIEFQENGKRTHLRFSYAHCSPEEAMAKALEKQKELRSR